MNLVLFDEPALRRQLLPLTFTRPIASLRCGILTLAEKWQYLLPNATISHLTETYLQQKFELITGSDNLLVNGAICPTAALISKIQQLEPGSGLVQEGTLLAFRGGPHVIDLYRSGAYAPVQEQEWEEPLTLIRHPWHIFSFNGEQLRSDFALVTQGRTSAGINDVHTRTYNEEAIFVEEGAKIRAAVLNAEEGPIYIGKNAQVHEGAVIKGPFALCEESNVNVGAKMRHNTTVGPYSKIGGEVSNSVILGQSNKGHEGFLGNSVLGEWCNLGADTNNSNLKNNYANVKLWSYKKGGFVDTGLQFCGLIMGDHSKCGINTMFNTGTVVGVSANIFGDGFPRNFIPSYSWGGANGFTTYKFDAAMETANLVMERRQLSLSETERSILQHVFEQTAQYRVWENKKL